MNFNPSNDKLMFCGRNASRQYTPVFNRIYRYFPLILRMDVRDMVFVGVMEEQPDQDPVKH